MFTPPQPKYYAYQEELRNNPLIERSINLITLAGILLIVVMIPTEGIYGSQWRQPCTGRRETQLPSGSGGRGGRGGRRRGGEEEEEEEEKKMSLRMDGESERTSECLNDGKEGEWLSGPSRGGPRRWHIQQNFLKAHYGPHRGDGGVDKTFISKDRRLSGYYFLIAPRKNIWGRRRRPPEGQTK